ncbi:MAG: dihydroorotate dehydrogenase-like protein [Candidatus Eisenbacteria bacterium]|nr:dihydroorotate dehydrogenase-like protein [Candidatus Eisenbacteria bacterium]
MDLSTKYLGFDLPHPLMPGASPLVDDLDTVRRLEDAGAAAIVLHSLFEEQLTSEQMTMARLLAFEHVTAEASTYLPEAPHWNLGPDEYLDQVRKIKAAVKVPVIGSLNGSTLGGWLDYAKKIEQAGADALELNVYALATEAATSGEMVESKTIEMVRTVRASVRIPIAVKLSPFYSALPHFIHRLEEAGANGFVLFNRFYQPDIDVEELEVDRTLHLSDPSELPLRLRWLAVLSGHVKGSLAASGGVHSAIDALKAVMSGAHAVQLVSVLLARGPGHLQTVREQLAQWLEQHEYQSLRQAQGSMSLMRCPDPAGYERANYTQILQSWRA